MPPTPQTEPENATGPGISRRALLRGGGAALGLAATGYVGWQFRPVTAPDFVEEPDLGPDSLAEPRTAPDATAGTAPKLLVLYASMMGSTAGQAQVLAQQMRQQGFRTRLARIEDAPDPAKYDAVVLGSAIRTSNWLAPITDWAKTHRAALIDRPHALFQCSMTCAGLQLGNPDRLLSAENRAQLQNDLGGIFAAVPEFEAAPVEFFAGRLEFHRLAPMLRLLYPVVSGSTLHGDFRQPERIRAWARQIATRAEFAALRQG